MNITSTLDKKLFRDLWRLRGQVIAISLVIAAGLSAVMMSLATLDSLSASRAKFYADNGFASVFADLTRAPVSLAGRVREIPGVATVETRVAAGITLQMPDFHDPVRGYILSIPEGLNRLHLTAGRLPMPDRGDEIVIGQAFAEAHELSPVLHEPHHPCPVIFAYGEHETAEFKRQTDEYCERWRGTGQPAALAEVTGRNHFDVILDLADDGSWLARQVRAQMGLAQER